MKERALHKQILHLLLQQNEYMTSEQLSEALGVSRKTINNYRVQVKEEAERYGLTLVSKKGRGFLLEGESSYRKAVAAQLKPDMEQPAFQTERLLYLLHLLLNEADLIRISELQDILHLSRPSIYKICEEVDIWLSTYQLSLQKSRARGLMVSQGEKRHRLAIVQWMSECERFLKQQAKNKAFLDSLKLKKCLHYYDAAAWRNPLDDLMSELQKRLFVTFLPSDILFFKRNLQIILVRYREGNTIQLPEKRIHLIRLIDQHQILSWLQEFCLREFQIRLPESEVMYFFSLILVSDSYQDQIALDPLCLKEQVDEEIVHQLHQYLHTHLNLTKSRTTQFFTRLIHIMQRELVYQIHEKQQAGHDYYTAYSAHFQVLSVFAKELADQILQKYDICYYDKFVYHLTILLAGIVEQEKRRLRCVLLHDCNMIELEYMQIQLTSNLLSADIVQQLQANEIQELDLSGCDVILTCIPYTGSKDIPVVEIPKCMNYRDIVYCNQQIHELFQKINFRRIVKDPRMQFPNL